MKKYFIKISLLLLLALLISSTILNVSAHPGRTDSSGGHTDHDTGEYHYHHGYPAHNHYDMDGDGIVDCSYEIDDKTNLMKITDLLLVLFAALAILNLGVGLLLTIEKIFKSFGSKTNIWMYVYIIVTALGIVALKIIIERS